MEYRQYRPKSDIQQYEEMYQFLGSQVLMEINRFVTQKKASNNLENISAEKVLSDAIITTLSRFGIYDNNVPVAIGYCFFDYVSHRDTIDEEIQDLFPFPIVIDDLYRSCLFDYPLGTASRNNVLDILGTVYHFERLTGMKKSFDSLQTLQYKKFEDAIEEIKRCVAALQTHDPDQKGNRIEVDPWEMITIPITIFAVYKKESVAPQLRNMNITTEDISVMMAGDLLEQAIEILLRAPQ